MQSFCRFLTFHNLKHDIPIISLIPPKNIWSKSSLAAMIDMFKQGGFSVTYCDVESDCSHLIEILKQENFIDNILVFGTTFHHFSH